jgi:hypothetical protein
MLINYGAIMERNGRYNGGIVLTGISIQSGLKFVIGETAWKKK